VDIYLSNRSGVPLYEQIKAQIKAAIFSGELPPDSPLPSIRQLSRELKVSVITITRAYNDLAAEGLVANVQGKGCFVLACDKSVIREKTIARVNDGLRIAIRAARLGNVSQAELVQMLEILYREENDE
jgi:GntR family transcriptional regulator